MRYYQVKKKLMGGRKAAMFIITPLLAVIGAVPLLMSLYASVKVSSVELVWAVFFGTVCALILFANIRFPKRLERLYRKVGCKSDDEMDRLLDAAEEADGKYFLTDAYIIDFSFINAVPLSDVTEIWCHDYDIRVDKTKGRYRIDAKLGAAEAELAAFSSQEERDQFYEKIIARLGTHVRKGPQQIGFSPR